MAREGPKYTNKEFLTCSLFTCFPLFCFLKLSTALRLQNTVHKATTQGRTMKGFHVTYVNKCDSRKLCTSCGLQRNDKLVLAYLLVDVIFTGSFSKKTCVTIIKFIAYGYILIIIKGSFVFCISNLSLSAQQRGVII